MYYPQVNPMIAMLLSPNPLRFHVTTSTTFHDHLIDHDSLFTTQHWIGQHLDTLHDDLLFRRKKMKLEYRITLIPIP